MDEPLNLSEFGWLRLGLRQSFILKRLFTRALLTHRSVLLRTSGKANALRRRASPLAPSCCVSPCWRRISVAAVSCSSDTQRFESDKSFRSSHNQAPPSEVTGSVPQRHAAIQSAAAAAADRRRAPSTRPAVIGTAGGSPRHGVL